MKESMNGLFTRQQGTCAVHTPPRCFLRFIRTRGLFTRQQGTRGLLAPAFTTTVLVETNETQDHDITVLASLAAFKPFLALFTRPVNDAKKTTTTQDHDTPCNYRPTTASLAASRPFFALFTRPVNGTGPTLKPPILGTYAASTGL
jgi:hypothetical protein